MNDSAVRRVEDVIHHCRTQLELKTLSYTWSIANFLQTTKFVSKLYSNIFNNNFYLYISVGTNSFKLCLNIDESIKCDKKDIRASYNVFFITTEGEVKFASSRCNINQTHKELCDIPILLLTEQYLPNGTLTICIRFHIFENLGNSTINYLYKPVEMSVTDMESFVPNEKSDTLVTFVINKERLHANRILLCLKSKVFAAMFNCDLIENTNNEVKITDIKYDILQQLLSFLENGYLSEDVRTDAEVACELFIAAEKYDIKDLKLICEQYLIANITMENVIEFLKIAYVNNATVLTKYAKDFVKLHIKDIENTSNFKTLMQEYPELLIQIENIKLPYSCCNNLI